MAEFDPNAPDASGLLPLPPMYDDAGNFMLATGAGAPPAFGAPPLQAPPATLPLPPMGPSASSPIAAPAMPREETGATALPPPPEKAPEAATEGKPDHSWLRDISDAGNAVLRPNPIESVTVEPITPATPAPPGDDPRVRAVLDAKSPEERDAAYAKLPPELQDVTNDKLERAYEAMSPEARLRESAKVESARIEKQNTAILDAETARKKEAAANYAMLVQAQNETRARRAQLEQQITQLGNEKPQSLGVAASIGGVIASVVGGFASPFTGGRNLGLEAFEKSIDRSMQEQQQQFERKRGLLGLQNQSLGEREAQDQGDFRTREAQSALAYEQMIRGAQIEAQKYDPHGTTAMRIANLVTDARGRQQAAMAAWQQQDEKTRLERLKAVTEAGEKLAQARTAKRGLENPALEELLGFSPIGSGGAGGGAGGNTNPDYTVASTFFDPFNNEPIMGKREIGGKGKEKERETVGAQIATYGHVQDYWDKLHKIGAKIGYAKGLGESAWKARKGTLEDEYDKAREALTVYLTKELGDKLTQGQLDAQAHRIPERASVFDATDPKKIIEDAQEDADRDFMRDMNVVGVNAAPVILHAKQWRADRPQPDERDQVSASQQAVAAAPEGSKARKDAEAALEDANEQLAAKVAQERGGKSAVHVANTLAPVPMFPDVEQQGAMPPEVQASLEARNKAAEDFNLKLAKFRRVQAEHAEHASKLKGDVAAAREKHEKALEAAASDVALAKHALDSAEAPKRHLSKLEKVPGLLTPIPDGTPVIAPAPTAPPLPPMPPGGVPPMFAPRGPRAQ